MSKKKYERSTEVTEEPIVAEEPPVCLDPIGVVVNCDKLNVRVSPRITADRLTIIDKGTEVALCGKQPKSEEWCRVRVGEKTVGFCMKKYIEIQ